MGKKIVDHSGVVGALPVAAVYGNVFCQCNALYVPINNGVSNGDEMTSCDTKQGIFKAN